MMSKFKVGGKVKILPSAINDGVSSEAHNKTGKITAIGCDACSVFMDDKQYNNGSYGWAVSFCNIIPALEKGQQLLLWGDIFD